MHGEALSPEIEEHIASASEDMGCTVDIIETEPFDGGILIRLNGDGNPWEHDEEEVHVTGHGDDHVHASHYHAAITQDGWHVAVNSQSSQLVGADVPPKCRILAWISRNPGEEGPSRVRARHEEALADAISARLWKIATMLDSMSAYLPTDGARRDLAKIMRRVAGT